MKCCSDLLQPHPHWWSCQNHLLESQEEREREKQRERKKKERERETKTIPHDQLLIGWVELTKWISKARERVVNSSRGQGVSSVPLITLLLCV